MKIIFKGDAVYEVSLEEHVVSIGYDRIVILNRKVETDSVPWNSIIPSEWTIPMDIVKEIKL